MKDVGSVATPKVIGTWVEVYRLYQELRGERRERLEQVADRLGISFKVARRRLRNYEAMIKTGRAPGEIETLPRQVTQEKRPAVNTEFQDRVLTCADCGEEFTWGAKDQSFFGERGFEPPKRCPSCRRANRQRQAEAGAMKGGER